MAAVSSDNASAARPAGASALTMFEVAESASLSRSMWTEGWSTGERRDGSEAQHDARGCRSRGNDPECSTTRPVCRASMAG
jgi:hypothetical protein